MTSLYDLYKELTNCEEHPTMVVCDAKIKWGKIVLDQKEGETFFDGFMHAYIQRGDQTFLVPLYEVKEL